MSTYISLCLYFAVGETMGSQVQNAWLGGGGLYISGGGEVFFFNLEVHIPCIDALYSGMCSVSETLW
jgi:hypothetical protein